MLIHKKIFSCLILIALLNGCTKKYTTPRLPIITEDNADFVSTKANITLIGSWWDEEFTHGFFLGYHNAAWKALHVKIINNSELRYILKKEGIFPRPGVSSEFIGTSRWPLYLSGFGFASLPFGLMLIETIAHLSPTHVLFYSPHGHVLLMALETLAVFYITASWLIIIVPYGIACGYDYWLHYRNKQSLPHALRHVFETEALTISPHSIEEFVLMIPKTSLLPAKKQKLLSSKEPNVSISCYSSDGTELTFSIPHMQ